MINDNELERALKLLEEIGKNSKPFKFPEWTPPPPDPNACQHPGMVLPEFDSELARTMSAIEVRRRFPRGNWHCQKCESSVITYASFEHYIAGDW